MLIVDGRQESLAMYALGLMGMGFYPVTAETADDGFARACETRPEAVVVITSGADISGTELTRRLRADSRTQSTGIIVLAGPWSEGVGRAASDAGCDRVLRKPCALNAIALEIRDVLASRRRASTMNAVNGRV